MGKIHITVDGRKIEVEHEGEKVTKWEDKTNLSRFFLLRLDRINKLHKGKYNRPLRKDCFRNKENQGFTAVLTRKGGDSTTWRIVLITLQTLAWAGSFSLVIKCLNNNLTRR